MTTTARAGWLSLIGLRAPTLVAHSVGGRLGSVGQARPALKIAEDVGAVARVLAGGVEDRLIVPGRGLAPLLRLEDETSPALVQNHPPFQRREIPARSRLLGEFGRQIGLRRLGDQVVELVRIGSDIEELGRAVGF